MSRSPGTRVEPGPDPDGATGTSGDAHQRFGTDALLEHAATVAPLFARVALGAGFLSAVADRFGLWGAPGAEGVAWGSFEHFMASTGTLNPWFPDAWIPAVAVGVTAAEVLLAAGLLAGWRTRIVGATAGCLLLAFGLGMSAGTGLKSALDASVFAAAAASFLLVRTGGGPVSLDGRTNS